MFSHVFTVILAMRCHVPLFSTAYGRISSVAGVEMPAFREAFEWRVVGGSAIKKRKRKVDRANFKLQIQGNRSLSASESPLPSCDSGAFRVLYARSIQIC